MAQGRIYYRNIAGELVVLDAKTGNPMCRKDIRAAVGGDFVIRFAFGDKVLVQTETKEKQLYTYSTVMVSPTEVWKGVVRFSAISGKDGAVVWKHEFPTLLTPYYHSGVFKAADRIWLSRWGEPIPEPEGTTPVPACATVLDACVRFLYQIGEQSLPAAFAVIARRLGQGDAREMLSESNTVFRLQVLLARFVYGNPHRLKSDPGLRAAVLHLLDELVESGSSSAYRTRDDFVTLIGPSVPHHSPSTGDTPP